MSTLELRIPPVVLVLVAAVSMWSVAEAIPRLAFSLPWRVEVAAALVVSGLLTAAAGVAAFHRARTTVNPTTPEASSTVVASGIYGWSRNPMYLGFLLVLLGWGAYLGNVIALLLVAAFVAYMTRYQIKPEERALQAKFGIAYTEYMQRVRRWL